MMFRSSPVSVVDVGDGIWSDISYGVPSKASGRSAGVAIERAVELCLQRTVRAVVTAPTSKEALALAGYGFPGQTEMVALLSRSQCVAMMLVSPAMRIGLVTIHTPLRAVADSLSVDKVVDKAVIIHDSLRRDFAIRTPKIAVLALNPHAGENGLLGTEERDILVPALAVLRERGIAAAGPFPADAFFGNHGYRKYDAVLAMYHDQGLIPLKLGGFETGVNYSAGLSIVRTSPDHGTAYDIAGKRKANPASMVAAIQLALRIVRLRDRHDRTA
jgi:4-hydroxythreonine-4-phosphate dehydrogenase